MIPSFVAFDLDGTVFSHPLHPVLTPAVATQLQRAHDLGSKVIVVSGRPWTMVGSSVLSLPGLDLQVNMNGAAVTDHDHAIVLERPIPWAVVDDLLARGRGHGEAWCLFYGDETFFERGQRDYLLGGGRDRQRGCRPPEPLDSAEGPMEASWSVDSIDPYLDRDRPVLKLSVSLAAGDPRLISLQDELMAAGELEVALMDGVSLELTAKGVDKGSTLAMVADELGLDPSQGVCFGDGENDLSLTARPWTFVAMANADESVAAVADDHTASVDEDGVALWLAAHLG